MHLYCSSCGGNLSVGSGYCPHCGADIANDSIWQMLAGVGGSGGAIVGITLYKALGLNHLVGNWKAGALVGCATISSLIGILLVVCMQLWLQNRKQMQLQKEAMLRRRRSRGRSNSTVLAPASAVTETAPLLDFAALARRQEAALLASGDYRSCPHCAELVKTNAHICRFCQRDIVKTPQDR